MYAIQGNFDRVGGTSSKHKEHTQWKEKAKKDVQISSVLLERLNVNFFSINMEHLE